MGVSWPTCDMVVGADVWPLGKVVAGSICGVVVTGAVVSEGLVAPGAGRLPMAWGWDSTSSRILAEFAIKRVGVRNKRQRIALQVLPQLCRKMLAILHTRT